MMMWKRREGLNACCREEKIDVMRLEWGKLGGKYRGEALKSMKEFSMDGKNFESCQNVLKGCQNLFKNVQNKHQLSRIEE
jgi:hypothetical protein